MGKLTFFAGMAAGYVLGARAGRQRYEQIRRTSGKVWNSDPVQKQVSTAKEVARTKAAPVVADMVADAARATGEKLRTSRIVGGETIEDAPRPAASGGHDERPSGTLADRLRGRPVGRRDVAHRRRRLNPSTQAGRRRGNDPCSSAARCTAHTGHAELRAPCGAELRRGRFPVLRNRRPVHRASTARCRDAPRSRAPTDPPLKRSRSESQSRKGPTGSRSEVRDPPDTSRGRFRRRCRLTGYHRAKPATPVQRR